MIKYYVVPEDKKIIAVLQNCEWDALNKIEKMWGNFDCMMSSRKYMMKNQYRVVVKCHEDDTFDVEIGKKIAKDKLMKRYYKDFDARIQMFRNDLAKTLARVDEYIKENAAKSA